MLGRAEATDVEEGKRFDDDSGDGRPTDETLKERLALICTAKDEFELRVL